MTKMLSFAQLIDTTGQQGFSLIVYVQQELHTQRNTFFGFNQTSAPF